MHPHPRSESAERHEGRHAEQSRRLSFTAEQWVPFPVGCVFAFLADPKNLPRLMPRWQQARIDSVELCPAEGRPIPGAAGRGSRILTSFRPVRFSPVRLRWLALIDDYVADHHFCDLQVSGPFSYWRHCHMVTPETHGDVEGTRILDAVDYAWPGGQAGQAFDVLGRLQLRWLFRYRQRQLERLLRANNDG